MAGARCQGCGTDAPPGARFCIGCGERLGVPAPVGDAPHAPVSDGGPRLVECEECGAGNAASRPLCARCGTPLRDEVPGGDALPDADAGALPDQARTSSRRESPSVLLALVILAGLITAGVLLALVTSRVTAEDDPVVPTGLALQSASASSSLADHPPSLAIDGDPTTAWTEAAEGEGPGEWIEVVLQVEAPVRRVIVWNGDQRDDTRFAENGRATSVRIEVADRQFRVGLLDIPGPQAIDLPEAVTAQRVRIVVEEAAAGTRYTDLAISEIVIEGG